MIEVQSRKEMIYLVKILTVANEHKEALYYTKLFITKNPVLSKDERNIFANTFKQAMKKRRASWRILTSLEKSETQNHKIVTIREMKFEVENEIKNLIAEMLSLIDEYLLQSLDEHSDLEVIIFYFKLKGDYLRYLTEITYGEEKQEAAEKTKETYNQAYNLAEEHLPITSSTRLGLILNFSLFLWEILEMKQEAFYVAQTGFDLSYEVLNELEKNKGKESILIIQLLRENLMTWSREIEIVEEDELNEMPQEEEDEF